MKALYEDLEKFVNCEDFEEDLKEVLQEAYPNYLNVLEKRRRDMDKTDHAVVIAGIVNLKVVVIFTMFQTVVALDISYALVKIPSFITSYSSSSYKIITSVQPVTNIVFNNRN